MGTQLLTEEVKISTLADHTAAGTTTINGTALDMAGFDGAVIMAALGVASGNDNFLKIGQADQSNLSDIADIAGSKMVPSANNEMLIQDIYRPTDRYLVPYLVRGVSSLASPITAIRYKGRKFPVDSNETGEVQVEQKVSPAEGTA